MSFPGLRSRELGALLKEALTEWSADNAQRLGASLAFYTLLSLAPIVVVVIAVAALVFGKDAVRGQLAWQIQNLVGLNAAQAIQALIQGAQKPTAGIVASILSLLTLLFGSSSVVIELQDALNTNLAGSIRSRDYTVGQLLDAS